MAPKHPSKQEIIKTLFNTLELENSKNISELSNLTGFYHSTVKKYLEMIEYIQAQPKLVLERTGHSYQAKLEG